MEEKEEANRKSATQPERSSNSQTHPLANMPSSSYEEAMADHGETMLHGREEPSVPTARREKASEARRHRRRREEAEGKGSWRTYKA